VKNTESFDIFGNSIACFLSKVRLVTFYNNFSCFPFKFYVKDLFKNNSAQRVLRVTYHSSSERVNNHVKFPISFIIL
jgi:hypothetical protein